MTLPRRSTSRDRDAELRRYVSRLARFPRTPDLSVSILERVGRERPFVNAPGRRRLRILRSIPVLCVLLLLGGIAVLQRVQRDQPAPADRSVVSALLHAGQTDVTSGTAAFSSALDAAARRWVADIASRAAMAAAPSPTLGEREPPLTLMHLHGPDDARPPLALFAGSVGVDDRHDWLGAGAAPRNLFSESAAPHWLWPFRLGWAMSGTPPRSHSVENEGPRARDDSGEPDK